MLEKIIDSVFSMISEKLMEYAQEDTARSIHYYTTLQTLERNLTSLSAKATDVEAEVKNAELSGQKKRKREVEKWLQKVKKIRVDIHALGGEVQSEGFVSRFLGGDRAAELKERVDELVEQSKNFGEVVLDARKIRGETLLAPRLVGKAFKENLKRIWELLRANNVTRIGIYGMGGVGKTTLTKHINNILVEKKTQECVFWVTVSQECSIRMLQDKIANVVEIPLSDEYDEDKRAARLYQALSSRMNFVLILDDVWKNISLEKVGIPLHVESSRLIITTRSLQVCRQIGCQQVIQVKKLDMNEASKLFSDTLGQEVTLSPQVDEIAKCMAKMCDGLPLGIITLAGSMRGETAIHVWRNALEELRKSVMVHEDMEDYVFKVLKYSFDRLNPKHQQGESNEGYTELQRCFLYCSLYPEDYKICKQGLARKFILEELVDKKKSRGAQVDQVHTILDKLVNVCLLESAKDDMGFDCVKMHDLVRAMAVKITQGKNMVFAGCLLKRIPNEDEYWTKDVEKMSLMENSIQKIPDGMSPNCPHLSTLLLQGNVFLEFIADSFFSHMHGLCVLDLSNSQGIIELPNSLSDLGRLKALILGRCCKLVKVPYLGNLKALKELDLAFTAIEEMPRGMDELVNLKFLSMDHAKCLMEIPRGLLRNFPYLQCLHLPKQIEAPTIEMDSLRKLEEFTGRVNDAADFNRVIGCRPLIRYSIIVGGTPGYDDDDCVHWFDNYNKVAVVGCNYDSMEDAAILANNAQHLIIDKCEGLSKSFLDDFPKFNNPKPLKSLRVYDCEGIEWILAKNQEFESLHAALLGTLENIELRGLPDFMGIIEVALPTPARAVFSSLQELIIIKCQKMKNLGLTGSEFPNLELIRVESCEEIEEVLIDKGGVVSFLKLKKLFLYHLPKLKHVGTTTICDSIEYIQIEGCGALKKLPLYFPVIIDGGESSNVCYSRPPALKTISLIQGEEEWWESLEWDHPSHKHLLQPFLVFTLKHPDLTAIRFRRLKRFRNQT